MLQLQHLHATKRITWKHRGFETFKSVFACSAITITGVNFHEICLFIFASAYVSYVYTIVRHCSELTEWKVTSFSFIHKVYLLSNSIYMPFRNQKRITVRLPNLILPSLMPIAFWNFQVNKSCNEKLNFALIFKNQIYKFSLQSVRNDRTQKKVRYISINKIEYILRIYIWNVNRLFYETMIRVQGSFVGESSPPLFISWLWIHIYGNRKGMRCGVRGAGYTTL